MENHTYPDYVLLLEGLKVTQDSSYPAFIAFLLIYIFAIMANFGLIVLISLERNLHQPMYFLFCNLHLNDIVGATVVMPRLLLDILTTAPERYITYIDCVIQAFCSHVYATTSHTILMIMAFDRLSIFNPYCDNASLFKLSCESVLINNIYGLTFTVVLFVTSMGSISLTYLLIAIVCLRSKSSTLNSKALITCSTHLLVYLILLGCGFTIIILHRFPAYADLRKLCSVLGSVVPTCVNPIIYGLQTKEIKHMIFTVFHRANVAAS
uniref:G-protein coupled receptors family 1 profile domain-containing protein n=1 Tax=Esox lucius TaxID=8010 RepID=A0A6Q2ZFS5_ESOLU